ncbi:MAG: diguanylate cyclase [Fibrobacter sp.]|nr:diguanylate cyclase [Fibrobacter sp.]
MIKKWIQKRISNNPSFEMVMFWGILGSCWLTTLVSAIYSLFEHISTTAVVGCFLASLFFFVLGAIAFITKKYRASYFVMCFGLCTFIVSPLFFYFGGFHCGMLLYCLASILICALYSQFRGRVVLVSYAVILYLTLFAYAWKHPELSTQVPPDYTIRDIMTSFVILSGLMFSIVSYLLKAYYQERRTKDELIQKLDFFSTHDPLTSLHNRRYFIDYLKEKILSNPREFFILMYDVDHFKKLNDKYGHLFGDKVLARIGEIANAFCLVPGEIAVRYGGEEFIQVIVATDLERAFAKAEAFRNSVSSISLDEEPSAKVHISGGLIDCSKPEYTSHDKMLSSVDALLYAAKTSGRNKILHQE